MTKDLHQLFQEFIFECEFIRKLRPATIVGYKQAYTTLQKLIPDMSLDKMYSSTIIEFFKTLHERKRIVGKGTEKSGIEKSTAASYWSKLNSFFKWLVTNGHIQKNPFKGMAFPMPSYEDKKYLQKDEVERIFTAIHIHNKNLLIFKRSLVVVHLLLFCGLRKAELLLLQIRDIDFERKMLTIRAQTSKAGTSRQIPIHSSTLLHLKDYIEERKAYKTPFVLVSTMHDDKLSDDGLIHLIRRLRTLSGVSFHLHQFRHTFAVNFLQATNNIFALRNLLGHKDIRVTTLYLRCLPPGQMRADIESMSIDNFL